ncbi:acetyl-CoA carboxylase family protein [Actinomadura rugatobispora]|uniref:acetyl-CoA carboxylase n=1 Tax=Actinomadura rugatobispora TaxID=1994 RepID=A0ABW0ZTK1_9ACTN|nr:pyruvate carboxylase [Actinomadura rugatobispora]
MPRAVSNEPETWPDPPAPAEWSAGGLLIANRGEIAIRVARTAAECDIRSVAVYAEDDAASPHRAHADEAVGLTGGGPGAYLDIAQLVDVARRAGCVAVHPGYGFLSESTEFAAECERLGLVFVGPRPRTLALFGDKLAARRLARDCGIPVSAGPDEPVTVERAKAFLAELGDGAAILLKSVSGGGGRGIRVVRDESELDEAYVRASAEAGLAFGSGAVYAEELIQRARHIEVQVVGDGTGAVTDLGERECSVQRRHQKLIETAPAVALPEPVRRELGGAARRLAEAVRLRGVATVEFLLRPDGRFVFLEVNPRLQVEHTVTEEVTGVDLVATQLAIAAGASLGDLGLGPGEAPRVRGRAIQVRVNAEMMSPDGSTRAEGGTLSVYEPPTGPGVRVDGCGLAGYTVNPRYDSLLAKVVVHTASEEVAVTAAKADRALREFRLEGVAVNLGLLRAVLRHPAFTAGRLVTGFVDENAAELTEAASAFVQHDLATGKDESPDLPPGSTSVGAPSPGVVVEVTVAAGDDVRPGGQVAVIEAMKMQTVVTASSGGVVREICVSVGDVVEHGSRLAILDDTGGTAAEDTADRVLDLDAIRPDLQEVLRHRTAILDEARPEAVRSRHRLNRRTARENVADLCDDGSFVEYGGLAVAAQRARRDLADLIDRTPADGLVAGIGRINGADFPDERASCAVMSYDYTVLAGTQGMQGHRKSDRLFDLVKRFRLPVVLFAEGGGGRPGDTDYAGVGYGDLVTFPLFSGLSGLVPTVGVASGRCFAGNAALLGCCDVIIATADATIGMAGPQMIEGAGLGRFAPEEVGPASVQTANGVIDVLVADDRAAVETARRYLAYFQGPLSSWECEDQRTLRWLVPENRKRVYDIRSVISVLADSGSVLELREGFGTAIVTALARVEGRPVGIVANNPLRLGGAIDADAADKATRFLRLCDAFDLPVLFLCDTPGFMVGPEAEKQAQVRHFARLFLLGAALTVPTFTVVLRKGYGLGGVAMAGGSWRLPIFTIAWPTGEFGAMGLEGAVRLAHRAELAAIEDPAERQRVYEEMVAGEYERGKALNAATYFEIDDVVDPAETRARLAHALAARPPSRPARAEGRRHLVDSW